MPTLYMMIGSPGSGKSTWAHKFQQNRLNTMYISRDEIRMSILADNEQYFSHEDDVYEHFVEAIVNGLVHNYDVIADATHLSRNSRIKLVKSLQAHALLAEQYEIIFIHMLTPLDECVRRDALRQGRAHVTDTVIRRMWYQAQAPQIHEFPNVKGVWSIYE